MSEFTFDKNKNYILLGETGSGKSEISANMALAIAGESHNVRLFDLDQSKPMFRTRDLEKKMSDSGVSVHYGEQFWDSPIVASRVNVGLRESDSTAILDVGGGENSARVIGSFRAQIEATETEVLYILNPYRPYSGSIDDINTTLSTILTHCRLNKYKLVINPNVGYTTSAEDVIAGYEKIKALLPDEVIPLCLCANKEVCDEISQKIDLPIFPLDLQFIYTWSENDS